MSSTKWAIDTFKGCFPPRVAQYLGKVRRGGAGQTAFRGGRASGGRRSCRHPSPAGRGRAPACRSGDGVTARVRRSLGAGMSWCDAQPHLSAPVSLLPCIPCSPALGWGRVFPEGNWGWKVILEHMDLHRILHCLCLSNTVCTFDVISSVIKLTPK